MSVATIKTTPVKESRRAQVDYNNLGFGKQFADHMLRLDYDDGKWSEPEILPYGPMSFEPGLLALHYSQSIFEGMKAYKNDDGEIFLFRPDENIKRMNRSGERMCMPAIPEEVFMDGLKALVKLDQDWIPNESQGSLYIRPLLFATDEFIGVHPSSKYTFLIMTGPAAGYYSEPVKVKIETEFTRACDGGVGEAKTAGNYAASLYPAQKAREQGFHQLIWTMLNRTNT